MSGPAGPVTARRRFSALAASMQALAQRYPEWRTWCCSIAAWALFVAAWPIAAHYGGHGDSSIYCSPSGQVRVGERAIYAQRWPEGDTFLNALSTNISGGQVSWLLMVVAMMYPLLNEPVRNIAFSVRRKDRNSAIWLFLAGYTFVWALAGVLFFLLPLCTDIIVTPGNRVGGGLVKASGFMMAATLVWLPSHPVKMAKCGQTMPVRIYGLQRISDCLRYGFRTGLACLAMCWAPMAALAVAHHNMLLMYAVTVVLIYERYLLTHTSRLSAYAWLLIAVVVFGMQVWL